jgi:primosomal protein N' (replication factor Y) (superfamily II helicase)
VLLPLPLSGAYDYAVAANGPVARGTLVRAPLGKRDLLGVVWGRAEGAVESEKLRTAALLDEHRLPEPLCNFVDWVARYTLSPPGSVLAQALRAKDAFDSGSPRKALIKSAGEAPLKLSDGRARVLKLMSDGLARMPSEIAELAGVSASVVKSLVQAHALEWIELPKFERIPEPDPDYRVTALTPDQLRAGEHLRDSVRKREFSVTLLDGVTGSGKTEAYFEGIAEALNAHRQVLILLPEIALTVQFLDRFAARFGCRPLEWHSDLSDRARRRVYRAVLSGEARVVVGARSALFLPFARLGLIVVDEEHEQAYKQEDGVIYHARDMAVVRSRLENCPVVLASATPSLETYINAKNGKYEWLRLAHRYGAADMPAVRLIDLRKDAGEPGQFLSPTLRAAIADTLAAREQVLLFLNRRGYAPLTLCTTCGHKETCRNCSAWMVEHRYRKRLVCHHCAFEAPIPERCPQCGAQGALMACGPGVERVEEEFRAAFPDARVAIASSDTFSGPTQAQSVIRALSDGDIDVLIGTQIVAKGHHFPQLTLAGIIDADLGGSAGDPRAAERSFQLLHQVAGRSGRGEKPGLVLIQTRSPEDPVIQALAKGQRDEFLEAEAHTRERNATPPFGRLAALILAGADADRVRETGRALALVAPKTRGVRVWGPAPAFYQVLRGRTRERLLVQAEKTIDVQSYLRAWLAAVKIPGTVRLTVDIDPINFF